MISIKKILLDLFFPPRCVACGAGGNLLCEPCRKSIRRVALPICQKCGRPVRVGLYCGICAKEALLIDGVRSVAIYGGVIREAIHALKYRGITSVTPELANMMAEYLQIYPLPADVLVPVPLHEKRERERGFNQSALLARELAVRTGRGIVEGCLIRVKHSTAQARSDSVGERKANVIDAFECVDGRLIGKKVLLIDDVCTTRSTLEACAKPVKKAGAVSVWGLTLATEGGVTSVEKE